MKRNERGMARSDMIHITMCMLSGVKDIKSQKLSCAVWPAGSRVRLLLRGMDQVGEFDGVLNEEHRNIVSDDVPVAFFCVDFHREAAHVARQIGRPLVAGHGRRNARTPVFFPLARWNRSALVISASNA